MRMLDAAARVGIDRITCTPHMRWNDFDQEKCEGEFLKLQEFAKQYDVRMNLGYEVYYERLMRIGIDQARNFVERGTDNLLLEFNTGGECVYGWEQVFYKLQTKYGLDLTVAHPERYTSVWEDFSVVYRMKDMGCRIQVSAGDLARGRLDKMAKCAKRLMKEGLCDELVSDAHSQEHYAVFKKMADKYDYR